MHCTEELLKLGLELINTNVQNITEESGIIADLGRKAAAEVKQQAQIDVATQEKIGAIGVNDQEKEKDVFVCNNLKERSIDIREAERETKTRVEELEAEELLAVNLTRQKKAESDAALAIVKAEFQKQSEIARKEGEAAIAEAEANAKTRVALAQAEQFEAETRASLESQAKVEKAKTILYSSAEAEHIKILAEAEAHKAFTIAKAAARGNAQGLKEKADALKAIVDACGGSEAAYRMMLLEHLDTLAETSATAISNIKFDKVVVWDGGNGSGSGSGAVSSFVNDLTKVLPPTLDIVENIVGLDLKIPKKAEAYSGKKNNGSIRSVITPEEAKKLTTDQ